MDIAGFEDTVREAMNWLAVFRTEHELTEEVHDALHNKFHEIAEAAAEGDPRATGNTVRDTKAWVEVFAQEQEMSSEALMALRDKLEELSSQLTA